MDRVNMWVLIARIVEILFALFALGFSTSLAVNGSGSYYYSYSDALSISAAFCSAAVVLLAFFGLFGVRTRPDATHEAKLFLLILCIDFWAIVCSIAAGALLWSDVAYYGGFNWDDYEAGIAAAAVFAHLNILVILPLIIRTLRLWWKRMLYTVPNDRVPVSHTGIEYEQHPQYYQQVQHASPRPQPVEMKTNVSRPLSAAEESVFSSSTLAYRPSVADGPQRGPSRTSVQAAPPYTSRVEVGSKANRT